jgi:hypothetical protein
MRVSLVEEGSGLTAMSFRAGNFPGEGGVAGAAVG